MRLKIGGKLKVTEGAIKSGPLDLEILHIMKEEDQVLCKWYSVYSTEWKYECFRISLLAQLKRKRMVTYG